MAEALGVNVRSVYAVVFTLGTLLGTIGGALVVPTAAASLDMAIEFVIEAFAVVVIGGLGSMAGALVGALLVGLIRAVSLVVYPEFEILAIYLIVIAVLLFRPSGLFGKPADMMRGSALVLVAAARRRARPGADAGAALLRQPADARSSPTPSPCSGSICCSATPACCPSATPCSSGSAPTARP